MKRKRARGYTLIELIVSVGLFALVMMLVSGAYLMMINVTRQAQGLATGIDNLSFTLETMTRTIRTGTNYSCNSGGDCSSGGTTFSVTNSSGTTMVYTLSNGAIMQNNVVLTDPSVNVTSLKFYVTGTSKTSNGDYQQPHVTITISGTVSSGPGKTEPFSIETGATMRGTDL
jgi:prepilin-type N-terminal cleavage/methylation domain-containing protein